ncbi:MAG: hypothetical protein ACI8QC_001857 [Planctomycetota bacterium]
MSARSTISLQVHRLNAEFSDSPSAIGGEIRLLLQEALSADGTEAMVEAYLAMKEEYAPEACRPSLLPPLAWGLFRGGAREAGFALFELNYAEHPDSFPGHEDLAYGCKLMGNTARALKLAQAWAKAHPDHKSGKQLLVEIQRSSNQYSRLALGCPKVLLSAARFSMAVQALSRGSWKPAEGSCGTTGTD